MLYGFLDGSGRLDCVMNDSTVDELPPGAVAITQDQFESRYEWQLQGGVLVNVGLPTPVGLSREAIESLRLTAYANPIAGSDRYFAEAARMQAMSESGWEEVRSAGVARYQAIQAEYPWP